MKVFETNNKPSASKIEGIAANMDAEQIGAAEILATECMGKAFKECGTNN